MMDMYKEDVCGILTEFPFRIRYENEQAVDTGRDMFKFLGACICEEL